MEEKQDDALSKKKLLEKERLRKRFFGDKTLTKRPKVGSTEAGNANQQPTVDQKEAIKEDNLAYESNDALLERLAAQELLQEAARSKARAEVGGPSGWKKRHMKPNLRFVSNSVLQTEAQNRRKTKQSRKDI